MDEKHLDELIERLLHASRDAIDALAPVNTLPIVQDALTPLSKLVAEIEVATGRSGGNSSYWLKRTKPNAKN